MIYKFRALIETLISDTRNIFLIDSIGAFLTAFFVGVILVQFETEFGVPRKILFLLSFTACIYTAYSFCCYLFILSKWRFYLKIISVANMIYFCLTLGLVFYTYESLTRLGFIYFSMELIAMISLISIEITLLT